MKKLNTILILILASCLAANTTVALAHKSTGLKKSAQPLPKEVAAILKTKPISDYIFEYGIENQLRIMLGKNYSKFLSNFQNTGYPAKLKDKGIVITGYLDGQSVLTGILQIQPDGRLYAAYYDEKENAINYYGPKKENIPAMIRAWREDLLPHYNINEFDQNNQNINTPSKKGIDNNSFKSKATPSEYETFTRVMSSIWNAQFLGRQEIQINDDVIDVITDAEQQIYSCSIAFGWVPDAGIAFPGGIFSDFRGFIIKYVSQVVKNNWIISHDPRYAICVEAAAVKFKSPLIAASLGVF